MEKIWETLSAAETAARGVLTRSAMLARLNPTELNPAG